LKSFLFFLRNLLQQKKNPRKKMMQTTSNNTAPSDQNCPVNSNEIPPTHDEHIIALLSTAVDAALPPSVGFE